MKTETETADPVNRLAAMSYDERVAWAVGNLVLAIGEGKFREEVARLLFAISVEAYERGRADAEKLAADRERVRTMGARPRKGRTT